MTVAYFRRCRACQARDREAVARRATLAEMMTCCCWLLPVVREVHSAQAAH